MRVEPRYTEVLKWYRLFLKALNANTVPMPVYGEYDDTNHPSGTKATEPPVTPKPMVETTIYLDGETGEAQPTELTYFSHEVGCWQWLILSGRSYIK